MSVLTVEPKFLYPYSRQFPFDEVAEKIVKALEKRNWRVPGVNVEFYVYGSGEAKYKKVSYIQGEDFKLHFCRKQGKLDNTYNDTAALSEINIPKQEIEVYADESGPRYNLYVGNNWENDKDWFMDSIKVHSKLKKESRRYLQYTGKTYNSRASELVCDTDLDREYSPKGSEPQKINLEEKFKEFTSWLEEFVLNYILTFPEEDITKEATIELIPYEGPWSTIFSLCNPSDAERIQTGMENPKELLPEERHAYFGSGSRLVPLYVCCNERFPEIATDGFIWCDVNSNINQNSKKNEISDCIRSAQGSLDTKYIVAIKLKYANDIYVADNAKYEETRTKLFESIAPRDRLTDEELGDALAARGATIIPITDYNGDYKEPIVLINRELDFDEIEWIIDCHSK